ncbi:SDR family oxidoreductase [Pseudomaricurvus alkylphenolicus]|jgi:short-subunit dehydrogenase|uniref:SDR family oxidoreductase n=1 Tax=Pseudomaricurvus alkylphenolicus TaxID=1306991 RepID=UPI001423E5B1|nr:SDR family oxidoreductase [Pseudomaricurvus alkylphenolicus]NIB41915.1 SDR family oxidoreductase [Pseudomaricurvus alkylphenolicus]
MAKTVFITGASSGLGMAMAREFAARGYDLVLTARREALLDQLADELRGKSKVLAKALDVTDAVAVADVIEWAAREMKGLDIVVANAGVGTTMRVGSGRFEDIKTMLDTNIVGLMATVEAAVKLMRKQNRGHIVGISSVAGCRGLPSGAVYGATKSAVNTYLQALQAETARESIDVTILSPGYIDTPINQGSDNRPFLIDAQTGARKMVDRIEQKVAHAYVPGWPWALIAMLLKRLPNGILARAQ